MDPKNQSLLFYPEGFTTMVAIQGVEKQSLFNLNNVPKDQPHDVPFHGTQRLCLNGNRTRFFYTEKTGTEIHSEIVQAILKCGDEAKTL